MIAYCFIRCSSTFHYYCSVMTILSGQVLRQRWQHLQYKQSHSIHLSVHTDLTGAGEYPVKCCRMASLKHVLLDWSKALHNSFIVSDVCSMDLGEWHNTWPWMLYHLCLLWPLLVSSPSLSHMLPSAQPLLYLVY